MSLMRRGANAALQRRGDKRGRGLGPTTEEARCELTALIAKAKGIDPAQVRLSGAILDEIERRT